MDFFVSKQHVKPKRGDILISEPYLPDPNFERTVVYLCEHDENGTFGFVLNRKAKTHLSEIIEGTSNDASIFVGGPVQQDSLHFLHRNQNLASTSRKVGGDIFWGGDFDLLLEMINLGSLNSKDVRFFLGYSGWDTGQLESEMEENSWIVLQGATQEMIFDWDNHDLWKECLKTMGGKYRLMSNYPKDPRMN